MSWFEYPLQYSRIRPQYSGAWLDIYSQHFRNLFGYLPQYSGVWLDIQTQFLDIYEPQSVPAHPGPENLGSAMRTLDRRTAAAAGAALAAGGPPLHRAKPSNTLASASLDC